MHRTYLYAGVQDTDKFCSSSSTLVICDFVVPFLAYRIQIHKIVNNAFTTNTSAISMLISTPVPKKVTKIYILIPRANSYSTTNSSISFCPQDYVQCSFIAKHAP